MKPRTRRKRQKRSKQGGQYRRVCFYDGSRLVAAGKYGYKTTALDLNQILADIVGDTNFVEVIRATFHLRAYIGSQLDGLSVTPFILLARNGANYSAADIDSAESNIHSEIDNLVDTPHAYRLGRTSATLQSGVVQSSMDVTPEIKKLAQRFAESPLRPAADEPEMTLGGYLTSMPSKTVYFSFHFVLEFKTRGRPVAMVLQ